MRTCLCVCTRVRTCLCVARACWFVCTHKQIAVNRQTKALGKDIRNLFNHVSFPPTLMKSNKQDILCVLLGMNPIHKRLLHQLGFMQLGYMQIGWINAFLSSFLFSDSVLLLDFVKHWQNICGDSVHWLLIGFEIYYEMVMIRGDICDWNV